jgi:hypothetical protein
LLSLNFNNEPATKSIVQLSALEAESIVDYFIATMYAASQHQHQHQESMHTMNGNMIEASIPGSMGISPSPTIMQQHSSELYSNGGLAMTANSLRTHSSKFPVSIHVTVLIRERERGAHSIKLSSFERMTMKAR